MERGAGIALPLLLALSTPGVGPILATDPLPSSPGCGGGGEGWFCCPRGRHHPEFPDDIREPVRPGGV